jgi:hypothetical protein
MSENVTLTRNQRRAIAALIKHKSITDAADSCGLTDRTLHRYLDDPVFCQALTQAEGQAIDEATRRLVGMNESAIDAIDEVFSRTTEQAKLNLADFFVRKNFVDPETKQPATRLVLDIDRIKDLGHLVKKLKLKGDDIELESYDAQAAAALKLRAAQTVLDYMLRLRELRNVEERLTALEAALYGKVN